MAGRPQAGPAEISGNGAILAVEREGEGWRVAFVSEPRTSPQPLWFHVQVGGLEGAPVGFVWELADITLGSREELHLARPVLRADGGPWVRAEAVEVVKLPDGRQQVHFAHAGGADAVAAALCYPYAPAHLDATLAELHGAWQRAAIGITGAGRTLAVMAADTWRWQQSADADEHSRAGWEALWTTLIGWLIAPRAERQVVIDLGRDSFEAGEPVRALVYVRDADYRPVAGARVELTIDGPSPGTHGAAPTAASGEYSASFIAGDPGRYRVGVAAHLPDGGEIGGERRFDVTPPIGELTDRPRPEVLEAIAQATGGRCLPIERAAEMAELLPLAPVVEERTVELRPARTPAFFLVLLVIAGADWLLRRRWGVG